MSVKEALSIWEKGADIAINVEVVDDIPRTSSGKRRFVINRIPKP